MSYENKSYTKGSDPISAVYTNPTGFSGRGKSMKNAIGQNPQAPPTIPQQDPIPQTILIDCNRANANTTKFGKNYLHKWTCEFSGGIEIKTGDQISVNSAYLNSIGVGDLIAWTNSGDKEDNKARWLFEYYCSNDGRNDKREGYNLWGGRGKYPYPYDNKPAELMRVQKQYDIRDQTIARVKSGTDFSYAIDPYLNGRFFGLDNFYIHTAHDIPFTVRCDVYILPLSNSYHYADNPFSLIKFGRYATANTYTQLDSRYIIPVGNYFKIQSVEDPFAPVADRANYFNDIINYKFMCWGHYKDAGGNYYAMIERPIFWLPTNQLLNGNGDRSVTANISLLGSRGNCAYVPTNETNANLRGGRAFNYNDPSNYNLVGEKYYLYTNNGHPIYNNTDGTHDQMIGGANTGILTKQYTYDTHEEIAVVCREETLLINSYGIVVNALEWNYNGVFAQNYIEFTVSANRSSGATPVLNNVADLIALNGGLYNFTFNVLKPDGTQELIVSYAHSDNMGGVNPLPKIHFISTNRFKIQEAVIRDCANATTLDQVIGFNNIPQGDQFSNTWLSNGYENSIKVDWDYRVCKGRPYLSTTPTNFVGHSVNGYPTQNEVNPTLYGLVRIPPDDVIYDGNTNTATAYKGYNINTDKYLDNNFGKTFIGGTVSGNMDFMLISNPDLNNMEVKHYDFKDFAINDEYSSPSDIATTLTTQAHQIENARNNEGRVIQNSKAKGIIQSKFLIPVYTSFNDANVETISAETTYELEGSLDAGSYFLRKTIYDYPVNRFDNNKSLANGEYKIYFRTKHTTINKPQLPNGCETTSNLGSAGNKDFDVSGVGLEMNATKDTITLHGTPTAESKDIYGNVTGYPLQYIENEFCFISQFCGATTLTFSWNDTDSRFAISYMGQLAVDNFNITDGTGGDPSVTVYLPNPEGKDGYNFKAPSSRYGGVNIVNWCSYEIDDADNLPYRIYELYNIPTTTTLDSVITEGAGGSGLWLLNQTYNKNPVGNRFWNKLGYSDNQLFTTAVGYSRDSLTNEYIPNATTDILVDSAGGIITGGEPNENTPFGNSESNWDKNASNNKFVAGTTYGGIGGLEFGNHNVGYGIPSTAGRPLEFKSNQYTINSSNPFYAFDSTYNPDREEHTGYTYKSDTDLLTADNLPIKTESAYFYILSDLVKSDFYVSNDNGFNANIIGILSKLNSGGDFIYQYQAPQQFYAKRDAIITSVTTEIVTTTFDIPLALDPYSSVIYQITRQSPRPQPLQDPRWLVQQNYFNSIQQNIEYMLKAIKGQPKPSQTGRIQEIIHEVAGALITPNDNQADIIQRITSNYDRLGIANFRSNPQGLRNMLLQNPEAQNFLNDLNTMNTIQNRIPQAPQTISDPSSINPDSIYNTMMNITPQPQHTPVFLPPDQHDLAIHIIDTIHDAHQNGTPINSNDLSKLITSTVGMTPETSRAIHQLTSVYLEGMAVREPVTATVEPYQPDNAFADTDFTAQPQNPTDAPAVAVGLGSIMGAGRNELAEILGGAGAGILGFNDIQPITPDIIARLRGNLKSSGGSDYGSDTITSGGSSVGSGSYDNAVDDRDTGGGGGSSSGYYSGSRRTSQTTTSSVGLDRVEEAQEEKEE